VAHVLLCKLEKIFPPAFFNLMQHLLLHLPYEAQMGGLCSTIGAIQLRDIRRFFELNVKIYAKLKLTLQRHTFWRKCQTLQQNTMLTTFLACIIHPLVTMLAKMNRTSAFSECNLRSASDAIYKTMKHEEWRTIMLYVLTNLSEVEPYMR